ncbi:GNAT family N-acetyltransferase [Massilia sp. CFBP9012]|uniref:GNAT family N-acetyltransferase n=1 Tax=Massilia sp. CFBP9012 TaxID=3096531 RepID=UPI002A6AF85C|nr:GNAT family N-acetyltransferase [Massilia sp. CFBP9012]MDY0975295.1 GNAT family N-acetyltransferase [Massilia sp. CFBP9012]
MYTLPHPLRLRNADRDDAAFACALYASTRDDLRALPLPLAMVDNLIAMQQDAHEQGRRSVFPDAEVLILEHAGEPAGRIVFDATGAHWRLVDLALLPALRGRGLARAALLALQQRAGSRGASIGLSVMRSNVTAIGLYQRTGFAIVDSDELRHEMRWQPA